MVYFIGIKNPGEIADRFWDTVFSKWYKIGMVNFKKWKR